jgi:beta-lactam-binding protein with PASTA domain
MIKTIIDFLKSKFFWINILCAFAFAVLLGFLTLSFLKNYTHHGESVEVPVLLGLYESEAETILKKNDLIMEIVDSVYVRNEKPGAILEQTPKAGSKVKFGRIIYLTINAKSKRQIIMPDIKNVSKRQATYTLNSIGFSVGNIEVVPSEYADLVLDIKYQGRSVAVGEQLPDGAVVSIVVGENGSGYSGETVFVPILTGLTQSEAESKIAANNLIFGIVEYDVNPVNDADREKFMVYRQMPEPGERVIPGKRIDIWVSKDSNKIQNKKNEDDDFF